MDTTLKIFFVIENNLVKLTTGHRGQKNSVKAEDLPGLSTLDKIIFYTRLIPKPDLTFLTCSILVGSEDTSGRDEVLSRRV